MSISQQDHGDGTVTLSANISGGTYDTLSYSWDTGDTSVAITVDRPTGVLADTYGVTVTATGTGTNATAGTSDTASASTEVQPANGGS